MVGGMRRMRKVTVRLPETLLERAQEATGEGIGPVNPEIDLETLREDR